MPSFDRLRYRRADGALFLFALDLLRAQRPGFPPPAARNPQASARESAARRRTGRAAAQRAHRASRRRRVPPRLQARARRHRVETQGLALPLRPLARLAQDEEPGGTGGEAGSRGRLGRLASFCSDAFQKAGRGPKVFMTNHPAGLRVPFVTAVEASAWATPQTPVCAAL